MYKTFVVGYHPAAQSMAQAIEDEANRLEKEGYAVVSVAITPGATDIILAKKDEK